MGGKERDDGSPKFRALNAVAEAANGDFESESLRASEAARFAVAKGLSGSEVVGGPAERSVPFCG